MNDGRFARADNTSPVQASSMTQQVHVFLFVNVTLFGSCCFIFSENFQPLIYCKLLVGRVDLKPTSNQ